MAFVPGGPRFLRPWRFGAACAKALQERAHDVTIRLRQNLGQDVLYPQGGLHAASAMHNVGKHGHALMRAAARVVKQCDLAHWSFLRLEKKQYLGPDRPSLWSTVTWSRGTFSSITKSVAKGFG